MYDIHLLLQCDFRPFLRSGAFQTSWQAFFTFLIGLSKSRTVLPVAFLPTHWSAFHMFRLHVSVCVVSSTSELRGWNSCLLGDSSPCQLSQFCSRKSNRLFQQFPSRRASLFGSVGQDSAVEATLSHLPTRWTESISSSLPTLIHCKDKDLRGETDQVLSRLFYKTSFTQPPGWSDIMLIMSPGNRYYSEWYWCL